ncbi:MAG: LemA family protein [Verrucomicrobiota bacterium]
MNSKFYSAPMGPALVILIVLGGVVLLVGLWLMGAYNTLVRLRQAVKNAWAQIDVQLKRRHDLIPNLVNTVKGYATHEKSTLEAVINARARATSVTVPADKIKTERELSGALGRLLAVAESYPDLKANQNFLSLQSELASTEDRIAFSRQAYNDSATQLNTAVQSFPTVLIAGIFGFKEEPFFEAPAEEKSVPKVEF